MGIKKEVTPEELALFRDLTSRGQASPKNMRRVLDALEAADGRTDELESYIAKLVYALTDGKLSRAYDVAVITSEVEDIYQEHIREAVAEAEGRAAPLRAELDWLAKELAHTALNLQEDGARTKNESQYVIESRLTTPEYWKEAARSAVEAGHE